MDPRHVEIVQRTFAQVEAMDELPASIFYDELFAIAPSVQPLFTGDMHKQHRMFLLTLAYAVGGLSQLEYIRPKVEQLAIRHVAYGVTPEHYTYVGNALLRMLGKVLKDDYTLEIRQAWADAFHVLSEVMRKAANGPDYPLCKTG